MKAYDIMLIVLTIIISSIFLYYAIKAGVNETKLDFNGKEFCQNMGFDYYRIEQSKVYVCIDESGIERRFLAKENPTSK